MLWQYDVKATRGVSGPDIKNAIDSFLETQSGEWELVGFVPNASTVGATLVFKRPAPGQ